MHVKKYSNCSHIHTQVSAPQPSHSIPNTIHRQKHHFENRYFKKAAPAPTSATGVLAASKEIKAKLLIKVVNGTVLQTINDVLFGVISSGLSRYLDMRETKALRNGVQITGVAMVNLRPQTGLQQLSKLMNGDSGSRWGNKFGVILLPAYYHSGESDPLEFVKRSKAMIDKKKLSLEASFSYKLMASIISVLGPKFASMLKYRLLCNTTFTVSNLVGPQEEITIVGNPVKYIRATSSSLPHAITMHMVSYAGVADMQILVAKDVIPDPKLLAKCFEDALLDLKLAAEAALNS